MVKNIDYVEPEEERRIRITTDIDGKKLYAAQVLVTKRRWFGKAVQEWETLYSRCTSEKEVLDFFKLRDFTPTVEHKYL